MELTKRQQLILEKLIEQYVKTAEPVASAALAKEYDFGVKPAMIRREMEKLEKLGFLSQPFVSSGRMPTDKAYRFFVNKILERGMPQSKKTEKIADTLEKERNDFLKFTLEAVRFLAESSPSLALFSLPQEHILLKDGWEDIIREPEFANREFFGEFADFLADFEKQARDMISQDRLQIFIGNENPIAKAKNLTLISKTCSLPDGKKGILSLAGPKRMPYKENLGLLNSLINLMEKI